MSTTKAKHRRNDHQTSIAAAEKQLPDLRRTARFVLLTMRELHRKNGGIGVTDDEIIAACHGYVTQAGRKLKPNSFQTTRTHLYQVGYVEKGNLSRGGQTAWIPLTDAQVREKLAGAPTLF